MMKKIFQSTQILHAALLMGSLFFFVVALFIGDFILIQNLDENSELLIYVPLIFVPVCIFMSQFIDKKRLADPINTDTLEGKIEAYRNRIIIRSALIEGAILLAAVVVLLESHLYAAIAFIVGWVALLYLRPSLDEFTRDYNLTSQEQHEMMKD